MIQSISTKFRLYFVLEFLVFAILYLLWDFQDGEIDTHYLLHDPNLPGFSNLWGLILLPTVAYLGITLLDRHFLRKNPEKLTTLILRFLAGILFGAIISISFKMGNDNIPAAMMLGAIGLSFFVPLYRPEYILGFILSMVIVFGGVLPIIISSVLIVIFLIADGIKVGLLRLIK